MHVHLTGFLVAFDEVNI